jgi:hypothetical protein
MGVTRLRNCEAHQSVLILKYIFKELWEFSILMSNPLVVIKYIAHTSNSIYKGLGQVEFMWEPISFEPNLGQNYIKYLFVYLSN